MPRAGSTAEGSLAPFSRQHPVSTAALSRAPPFLFRTDSVLDQIPAFDPRLVATLKTSIAEAGVVLLVWGAWLATHGQGQRFRRTRDALLAVLGVAAFAGYFNFGRFHSPNFVHYYDFFHNYVGAKFFPELGYTRLYACASVADVEDGLRAESGTSVGPGSDDERGDIGSPSHPGAGLVQELISRLIGGSRFVTTSGGSGPA